MKRAFFLVKYLLSAKNFLFQKYTDLLEKEKRIPKFINLNTANSI
jgi:hypothetical protein